MAEYTIKKKQNTKFHKDTFDRTSEERRKVIIEVAIDEFASKGYSATSINDIAKKANISIGAMYSYFGSKEDLFLTIVNGSYAVLEESWKNAFENSSNILDYIELLLKTIRINALQNKKNNQIYLDVTTQALSQMSSRLSNKLELTNANYLCDMIRKAKEDGKIDRDIDENVTAFCIDNLLMMYQFSLSSDYYNERMKLYLNQDKLEDMDSVEESIMKFIRSALKFNKE